jgi:hypothetical protein
VSCDEMGSLTRQAISHDSDPTTGVEGKLPLSAG